MNNLPSLNLVAEQTRVLPATGGTRVFWPHFNLAGVEKLLPTLLVLVVATDLQSIAAITPQLARSLNTSATSVSYSLVVYAAAAALVAALLRFSRRNFNSRLSLPLAACIYSTACALTACSTGLISFLTARALTGLAGGLISALAITALAQASGYDKRGRRMTLISVGYYLAPLAGVPLSIWLAAQYGWRLVFAVTGLLAGAAAVLLRGVTRNFEAEVATSASQPDHHRLSISARLGIANAFFVSGGLIGFTAYLGTWLFESLSAKPEKVGVVYALINAGALAGGLLGGWLADRFGKRSVVKQGTAAMLLGLLLMATLALSTAMAEIMLVAIGLTVFAAALRVAPLQALLTELVAPKQRASYIALRNLSSQLGIGLGVLCCGRLYQIYSYAGVSAFCALLTAAAWLTIRAIREPETGT